MVEIAWNLTSCDDAILVWQDEVYQCQVCYACEISGRIQHKDPKAIVN